jgi:hypothetical protein
MMKWPTCSRCGKGALSHRLGGDQLLCDGATPGKFTAQDVLDVRAAIGRKATDKLRKRAAAENYARTPA